MNLTMKLRVFYSFPGLSSCYNFAIPASFSIINILAVKYIKFAKLQPCLIKNFKISSSENENLRRNLKIFYPQK